MSHTIELSDEHYETLRRAAEVPGESLDAVVADLIAELHASQAQPHYYETEEWFRHLGFTEEQIAESVRLAAESDDADA